MVRPVEAAIAFPFAEDTRYVDLRIQSFGSCMIEPMVSSGVPRAMAEGYVAERSAMRWVDLDGGQTYRRTPVYLAEWYRSLKSQCSLMYRQLEQANPSLGREDINALSELSSLNLVRRGAYAALKARYNELQRPWTQSNL